MDYEIAEYIYENRYVTINGVDVCVSMIKGQEIVRCRDCRKCQKDTIFGELWCEGRLVSPDGFCERGERDEDRKSVV